MTVQDGPLLEAALAYLRAGISILPCDLPNKNPAFRFLPRDDADKPVWEPWTRERVTEEEVRGWFADPKPPAAIGIIGGVISGNLEIIDIDDAALVKPWADQVKELDEGLFRGLVVERTMRGRCHVLYRCEDPVPGSQKLAIGSLDEKHKALVETKAEGGYVVAAPSPGYRILKGDLEELPVITAQERADLIQISRSFTRASVVTDAPAPTGDRSPGIDGDRPGDEFNRSGDWRAVLQAHGWTCIKRRGEEEGWRRPGKDKGGISATWNHVPNAFYVFSTGAHPLEDQKAYSPFALLTVLDYGGDWSFAARAIRGASWNRPPPPHDDADLVPPPPMDAVRAHGPAPAADAAEDVAPQPPDPPDYLRVVPDDPGAHQRPSIYAGASDLSKTIERAWLAIKGWDDPHTLFLLGDHFVVVEEDDRGAPLFRGIDPHRMQEIMSMAARWYTVKPGGKDKPLEKLDTKPPLELAKNLVANPFSRLPFISRTVSAPIVAQTGRIVSEQGYDIETRTFQVAKLDVGAISDAPSMDEIETARDLLLVDVLGDFPFVGEEDGDNFYRNSNRANCLALFLLPFARELIDGPTPLHLIEKSTPGSGASLIFQVLGRIVEGRDPSMITEASNDDEWRKTITSVLLPGPSIVAIDNLRRRLDSAALAGALTTAVWDARLLGGNDMARCPVRCTWIATGNNPSISNEITRRTVSIRIDPRVEKPWERDPKAFRHPKLLVWVAQNRGRLVNAALTLIRAWVAAGKPAGEESLGSFEEWATVMGGILDVAGVGGLMGNRADFYDRADRESLEWKDMLRTWWTIHGRSVLKASDIWTMIVDHDLEFPVGRGSEQSQKVTVGKAVGKAVGRRYSIKDGTAEMRTVEIAKTRPTRGAWQYLLVDVDNPEAGKTV